MLLLSKVDKNKLELAMARSKMTPYEVSANSKISYETLRKAINGISVKPSTVGRIAEALNVDVTELIQTEV